MCLFGENFSQKDEKKVENVKKSFNQQDEIKLVGIAIRTSNALEINSHTAQIGKVMQKFFGENLKEKILHRKNPCTFFSVYTHYESDANGEYTYFLGEEVTSFEDIADGFISLTIPPQNYVKFTSGPDKLPGLIIDMWQKIWKLDSQSLGGKRSYVADFEIYDERSQDPNSAVVDVYIGIQKNTL